MLQEKVADKSMISVVIPTANRSLLLKRMLNSILNSEFSQTYEIIIVDQSSDNLTKNMIQEYFSKINNIYYIHSNKTGAACARNYGWRAARGDIIAFTDDDAWVDKNWMSAIDEHFKLDYNCDTGVLGGPIIPVFENGDSIESLEYPVIYSYILPAYSQKREGEYLNGALPPSVNFVCRKSILEFYGGFCEKLGTNINSKFKIYGEDSLLASQVKMDKKKLLYLESVKVYHPVIEYRKSKDYFNEYMKIMGRTQFAISILLSKRPIIKRVCLFLRSILEMFCFAMYLDKSKFLKAYGSFQASFAFW
ncbi:glycosyltransferase family 2 protein [Leptospira sp. WS60.C2]